MANWIQVILAASTQNLCTNPSFETGSADWTMTSASTTGARKATYQRFGTWGLEITPGSAGNEGAYHGMTLTASTTYTATANVRATDGVGYQIYLFDTTTGSTLGSATTFTGSGNWTSASVSASTNGNTGVRIYIAKNSDNDTTAFYIDGVQVEAAGSPTTYCDGDQEGCEWLGTRHASKSQRSATSYAGGQIIDIEARTLKLMEIRGAGMPPLMALTHDRSFAPGEEYQHTKINPRLMHLAFHLPTTSASAAHSARKALGKRLPMDDDR